MRLLLSSEASLGAIFSNSDRTLRVPLFMPRVVAATCAVEPVANAYHAEVASERLVMKVVLMSHRTEAW